MTARNRLVATVSEPHAIPYAADPGPIATCAYPGGQAHGIPAGECPVSGGDG